MKERESRFKGPERRGKGARPSVIRGGRKGPFSRLIERVAAVWNRLLEMPALWLTLFLLLGAWALGPRGALFVPDFAPGSIAGRDFVAPRDLLLLDEESTLEKERRAREEVLPVYDLDTGLAAERQARLDRLFAEGRRLLEGAPEETEERIGHFASGLEEASTLPLTPAQLQVLVKMRFAPDLEDRTRGVTAQALQRGVVANKALLLENRIRGVTLQELRRGAERTHFDLYNHLDYPEEVRGFFEAEVRDWPRLTRAERQTVVELLLANTTPNLHLNQSETEARREAVADSVDRVFNRIRKGQIVVRKGDEVGPLAARVIAEIAGQRDLKRLLLPVAGILGLLAFAAVVLWLGVRREKVADHSHRRLLSESLLLTLGSLLGAKFTFLIAEALGAAFASGPLSSVESYVWAIPFASLALVSSLLFGRNVAVVLSLLFSLLISRLIPGDGLAIVIFCIAGSLAAIFAAETLQFKQRLVMSRIGLLVGAVNVVMILILLPLGGEFDRTAGELGLDLLCGLAGGLLVAAVASFSLPILESVLSITTDIKLIELANTNLPVLRRLAFEAPGSFQHSLMVANLAKEGCEAIGADPVLAYTGGLYHDIGKVYRPDYYIENQRSGHNPHDKLAPSMSSLILISHIKDGVELARRNHLPKPIIDAIEQHHGTRKMTFFYNRAVERCDPTQTVREEKYRYPGPKPQGKVMGVLMLADGVEAASRTLVRPETQQIRAVVRAIVEACLQDDQLDETDLTLLDIKKVSRAFERILETIFHQRIDYPGFDFKTQGRGREPAAKAS